MASKNMKFGLRNEDLSEEFFGKVLNKIEAGAKLVKSEKTQMNDSEGLMTTMTKNKDDQALYGKLAFRLHYTHASKKGYEEKDIVVKIRKETSDLQSQLGKFMSTLNEKLGQEVINISGNVFWKHITLRDLRSLTLGDLAPFKAILPDVYHMIEDSDRKIYAYVCDNFSSPKNGYTHLNMGDTPECWTDEDVEDCFKSLARMHALFLGRTGTIPTSLSTCLDQPLNLPTFLRIKPLIDEHHKFVMEKRPECFPDDILDAYDKAWANVAKIFDVLENASHSLIHNNCNIRNMCKRTVLKPGQDRTVIYDWEIIRIFPPQHDIVEFLYLWFPGSATHTDWYRFLDMYRQCLMDSLDNDQQTGNIKAWLEPFKFTLVCDMCALEFFIFRFNFYLTSSVIMDLKFLDRCMLVRNMIIRHLKSKYDFLN